MTNIRNFDMDERWPALPLHARMRHMIATAFETGMFWIEIMSAATSLALTYTGFQDVDWLLNETITQAILIGLFCAHAVFLFTRREQGYWVRMGALSLATGWWLCVGVMLALLGAQSAGIFAGVLAVLCFLDLLNLGAEV